MRAMVQRGDLGQIVRVQGRFFQDWLLHDSDYNWRLLAKEGGKLGIRRYWHALDRCRFLLFWERVWNVFSPTLETFYKKRLRPQGELQTFAHAERSLMIPYRVDTEDFASVLLKYGKSKHGLPMACTPMPQFPRWRPESNAACMWAFTGTKASVQWDLQQPNEILFGSRDEPNQVLQRGTARFTEDVAGFTDYPGGHPEGFSDSHKMQYRAVYEHIAKGGKGKALFATVEDGHEEVRLCEAVLRSGRSKQWVAM